MRKWLILLSAFTPMMAQAAPAWRWVDQNGQVHYSDRPVPGATQIDLPAAQAVGTQGQPSTTPNPPTPAASPPSETDTYTSASIASPAEQETLRGTGTITVQVAFEPALRPAHRYDLVLDGQRRNLTAVTPSVTLSNVFRGEHTLQVIVLDTTGRELMRSPVRTFFIQQVSTQNPNSPLGRRPATNGQN
jgi:hypothetical protein